MDWANSMQYMPYGWASGLMGGWDNKWGGSDSPASTGTDRSGYQAQRDGSYGGSDSKTAQDSAGFSGDANSGSYGMARDAAASLGKSALTQGLQGGLLGGFSGALSSMAGPGAIQGIANMATQATGYAPQTGWGKTLANAAPIGLGLVGGPIGGFVGLMGGSLLGGLAEDAMDAREAERTRDSMEDAYGGIAGRMAYSDAMKAAQDMQSPAGLSLAETIGRDLNPQYATDFAKSFVDAREAGRGARVNGALASGGPFADITGFSIDNALSAGRNTGGYGQRSGGFSGGNPGNGQGYGGGNSGGNNSGGQQGGKNGQGEGYGGR